MSAPNEGSGVEHWVAEYTAIRPLYEEYCFKLKHLIIDLVSELRVPLQSVESRPKTLDSFQEKISRAGKLYEKPLEEVTDLAGLRIILYYPEDVAKIREMLEGEFVVDPDRSVDKGKQLRPEEFGYQSVHLIVKLSKVRGALREWAKFKNLTAEIQVRTVLQHAWASISHALQYKHELEIPLKLRRKLLRLSGLLELADEQFSELRQEREVLSQEVVSLIAKEELNVPIDAVSVSKYLETSEVAASIRGEVKRTKLGLTDDDQGQGTSQLISTCKILNLSSLADLDVQLERVRDSVRRFFQNFKKHTEVQCTGSLKHWVAVLLIGSSKQRLSAQEVAQFTNWGIDYAHRVLRAGSE